jgi:hypothetical protein
MSSAVIASESTTTPPSLRGTLIFPDMFSLTLRYPIDELFHLDQWYHRHPFSPLLCPTPRDWHDTVAISSPASPSELVIVKIVQATLTSLMAGVEDDFRRWTNCDIYAHSCLESGWMQSRCVVSTPATSLTLMAEGVHGIMLVASTFDCRGGTIIRCWFAAACRQWKTRASTRSGPTWSVFHGATINHRN